MPRVAKDAFLTALIERSHHTNHFVSLLAGLQYFATSGGWLFAYKITMAVAYLAADPVTPAGMSTFGGERHDARRELTEAWREFSQHVGGRPIVLVGMSAEMRELAAEMPGLAIVKVGEEPWISLGTYAPRGNTCKGVRAGRNQAERAGCRVVEYALTSGAPNAVDDRVRGLITQVVEEWRATTLFHLDGLFMRTDVLAPLPGRRLFACWRDASLEAVLVATPVTMGQRYYFEDVITRPGSTNGAVELLILRAIEALRETGVAEVTLGVVALRNTGLTSPGSGVLKDILKRPVLAAIGSLYNLDGVELSRRRFKPNRWSPVYAAIQAPRLRWLPLPARLVLFALGLVVALSPKCQVWKRLKAAAAVALLLWAMGPALHESQAYGDPADETPVPSYHLVGFVNALVPGAGACLLGSCWTGALQATLETGTFAAGYLKTKGAPMTLDGVPEDIPVYYPGGNRRLNGGQRATHDIEGALWADWEQEFGIKLHMMNVFDAYREAIRRSGAQTEVDSSSVTALFLAPFRPAVLADFLTLGSIIGAAGAIAIDYTVALRSPPTKTPNFNTRSDNLYAATYIGMYPVGSAAPEEVFYRGYIQNELYGLVGSPFFSVPVASAMFGLSHQPEDRPSATVGGLLFGSLAYLSHNQLSRSIAVHYWVDVFSGLEEYMLYQRAQVAGRPHGRRSAQPQGLASSLAARAPSITLFDFVSVI